MGQNRFVELVSTQKLSNEYEFKIEKHQLANGKIFDYQIFDLPHFAVIIPVIGEKFILIKQYRPSWRRIAIEFPAGVADGYNEAPERTAGRELEEETGYRAGKLTLIGKFRHTSRSTQFCHSYVAEDLKMFGQKLDAEEYIEEIFEATADEIENFITNEEMVDISHIATWYRYRHQAESNGNLK